MDKVQRRKLEDKVEASAVMDEKVQRRKVDRQLCRIQVRIAEERDSANEKSDWRFRNDLILAEGILKKLQGKLSLKEDQAWCAQWASLDDRVRALAAGENVGTKATANFEFPSSLSSVSITFRQPL